MATTSGFYIIGRLDGFLSRVFTYDGKERVKNTIGLSIETLNKYGRIEKYTLDVNVHKDVITPSFNSLVSAMTDKMVQVKVSVKEWTLDNGNSGITYTFDENSEITELEE